MKTDLTQERLKEVLDYNKDSGIFTRKIKLSNATKIGDIAGSLEHTGYISISIDNIRYQAHRLAWLYEYGKWPKRFIDHKDTIKHNNSIDNLREANDFQNPLNSSIYKSNTSGQRGVSYFKKDKKWRVTLSIDGKSYYLGRFSIKDEAIKIAKAFILDNHGEFMYE